MRKSLFMVLAVSVLLASPIMAFRLVRIWVSEPVFEVPESVCYDRQREILYVSNIAGKPLEKNGEGFISRVGLDGRVKKLKWIKGLNAPKGMAVSGGRLYVADIDELVVIDIRTDKVIQRLAGRGAIFLNDVASDDKGNIYVSDASRENSVIYRLSGGEFDIWLEHEDLSRPNGLCMLGGVLIVGNSGDGTLRAVDVETREMSQKALVGSAIDGVEVDGKGNFIVSDWKGRTVIIDGEGYITVLLDTSAEEINAADIEFVEGEELVLIPTFYDNRVVAARLVYR
jgi:DNA-binding beta-propeller fold protein YncE